MSQRTEDKQVTRRQENRGKREKRKKIKLIKTERQQNEKGGQKEAR
jgi:hypothetical protein